MRFAAVIHAALAFFLARVIAGVHVKDLLLEKRFDRLLDLNLVGAGRHAEDILVQLLAQERRFFGQRRGVNDVVRFHYLAVLSAICSSAFGVTKIFWKASSCSVFTSF